jgi:hypothetical protein
MGVYLMGVDLMGMYLKGVYLTDVHFTGVDLIGLYLRRAFNGYVSHGCVSWVYVPVRATVGRRTHLGC